MVLWSLKKSQWYTKHDKKVWIEAINVLWLGKVLSLGKAKVVDVFSKRVMLRRFKRHHGLRIVVWELSNLIWASEVINVLKLTIESILDQESKEAPLEGEYFKKKNWYYGLKRKGGLVIGDTWELFNVPVKILELVEQVTWSKVNRYAK